MARRRRPMAARCRIRLSLLIKTAALRAAAHPPPGSASEGPPGTGAPTGTNEAPGQADLFRPQRRGTEDPFLSLDPPHRDGRLTGTVRGCLRAAASLTRAP